MIAIPAVLQDRGEPLLSDEELTARFDVADEEKNGSITFEEFMSWKVHAASHAALRAAFRAALHAALHAALF